MSPSSPSLTSTTSLTSYKRPKLGEGAEAPDLKKASLSTDPSVSVAAALQGYLASCGDLITAQEILVPDKMVGLIIGRGGDVNSRLQLESGAKIQMAPDSLGMLDR